MSASEKAGQKPRVVLVANNVTELGGAQRIVHVLAGGLADQFSHSPREAVLDRRRLPVGQNLGLAHQRLDLVDQQVDRAREGRAAALGDHRLAAAQVHDQLDLGVHVGVVGDHLHKVATVLHPAEPPNAWSQQALEKAR